jgi:predicted  nucleic acid-binding Zn-ribbon protein
MNQAPSLLSLLLEIAKIDSNLAHIAAEELRCRKDLSEREVALKKIVATLQSKSQILKEAQVRYQREEKALRDEQVKLMDRRKALASFPNYKLQQAAEREIDSAARETSGREELLLSQLDLIDSLEKETQSLQQKSSSEETELDEAAREFKEMKTGFDERRTRQSQRREALVARVDPGSYQTYTRVLDKYRMDPLVALSGKNCSGCHMQLGPQVLVTLHKQESLVRCPGCSRIVYLADLLTPVE